MKLYVHSLLDKLKWHILLSKAFFLISCLCWDTVDKYGRPRQDTDYNMERAHCMLDKEGYRHTVIICSTYCFSKATIVPRTRIKFTLYRRTPLTRRLVIRISNCPGRLGPSCNHFLVVIVLNIFGLKVFPPTVKYI